METNWFAHVGAHRQAHRRSDEAWLREVFNSPRARVVPVWRQLNLVSLDDGYAEPVYLKRTTSPLVASLELEAMTYLGEDEQCTYFGCDVKAALEPPAPAGSVYADLREMGGLLSPAAANVLAHARALAFWHQRHAFCGACGSPTRAEESGHVRACTRATCGLKHFPRTDPAVIVLAVDAGQGGSAASETDDLDAGTFEERCLLGRPMSWPPGLYSTIAGFVEPGESLETAVRREINEETGVIVDAVHYHSSQPWPFPSSLMLGFYASAIDTNIDLVDQELEDARWFSRAELVHEVAAGRLRLPRPISIAYRLLEAWFDRVPGTALRDVVANAHGRVGN